MAAEEVQKHGQPEPTSLDRRGEASHHRRSSAGWADGQRSVPSMPWRAQDLPRPWGAVPRCRVATFRPGNRGDQHQDTGQASSVQWSTGKTTSCASGGRSTGGAVDRLPPGTGTDGEMEALLQQQASSPGLGVPVPCGLLPRRSSGQTGRARNEAGPGAGSPKSALRSVCQCQRTAEPVTCWKAPKLSLPFGRTLQTRCDLWSMISATHLRLLNLPDSILWGDRQR